MDSDDTRVMPPLDRSSSPPSLITTPLGEDGCLALIVRDGRGELDRASLLRGTAREIAQALGPSASEAEVQAWLRACGAHSEAEVRADAQRFLDELQRLEPSPEGSIGRGSASPESPLEPEPEAWTRLARAVLASGHRLHFRAYGRSMRPFVPHGSLLEVEARAFESVRLGEVVLHATPLAPLVAHRVVGRAGPALLTRGDSNARLDRVTPEEFLGVVVARQVDGHWRSLSSPWARGAGMAAGLAYRVAVAVSRLVLLHPLRSTFTRRSWLRAGLRFSLRLASAASLTLERLAIRARRPVDVWRAALLSSAEKDAERARLYRRRAIQDFTALDENVRSGLTLLEEVLLARHPIHGRVLVLGCGPGREALVLARRGCTVTGLDREPGMLERARELAQAQGLVIHYLEGEAESFRIAGEPFDAIVLFSGLYNMLLPRARRVRLLESCRAHLKPDGRVLLTFLAAYHWPGDNVRAPGKHWLEAMNPDHERGDLYLLNEAIHVFPWDEDVAEEGKLAGLATVELYRDQRAYDRPLGQVRGYAVLRRPTDI
jgi:SAM-dependent methyltransferase